MNRNPCPSLSPMDVHFSPEGPPDIVLPEVEAALASRLEEARGDRDRLAVVIAEDPTFLAAWAALGDAAADAATSGAVEAYAYYRVGYHRGLDALRKNGWKGSGFVRWSAEPNRGFLRCLEGLGRMAVVLGEDHEATRCGEFLRQLDPSGPWAN